MGDSEQLSLRVGSNTILLHFDISSLAKEITITSATLKLFTYEQYGGTSMITGVFRSSQGESIIPIPPTTGIAEEYTMDQGIEENPQVILATSFESDNWRDEWSYAGGTIEVIGDDPDRQFNPLDGKALRALMPQGENSSMSVIYKFIDKIGQNLKKFTSATICVLLTTGSKRFMAVNSPVSVAPTA